MKKIQFILFTALIAFGMSNAFSELKIRDYHVLVVNMSTKTADVSCHEEHWFKPVEGLKEGKVTVEPSSKEAIQEVMEGKQPENLKGNFLTLEVNDAGTSGIVCEANGHKSVPMIYGHDDMVLVIAENGHLISKAYQHVRDAADAVGGVFKAIGPVLLELLKVLGELHPH